MVLQAPQQPPSLEEKEVATSGQGLSSAEAQQRLEQYGPNEPVTREKTRLAGLVGDS